MDLGIYPGFCGAVKESNFSTLFETLAEQTDLKLVGKDHRLHSKGTLHAWLFWKSTSRRGILCRLNFISHGPWVQLFVWWGYILHFPQRESFCLLTNSLFLFPLFTRFSSIWSSSTTSFASNTEVVCRNYCQQNGQASTNIVSLFPADFGGTLPPTYKAGNSI